MRTTGCRVECWRECWARCVRCWITSPVTIAKPCGIGAQLPANYYIMYCYVVALLVTL